MTEGVECHRIEGIEAAVTDPARAIVDCFPAIVPRLASVEVPFRPTRDLDLLGYSENTPEAIRAAFRAILTQPVDDDGVGFRRDRTKGSKPRRSAKSLFHLSLARDC